MCTGLACFAVTLPVPPRNSAIKAAVDRYHRRMPDPDSPAAAAGGSAPGPLNLIQSFASTVRADGDTDLLSAREEAATWLRAAGLLPADSGVTGSEHAALLRLRDSLREVLAAHASGQDAGAAARLTKALADGRLVLTVDPASTVNLASAARASYPNIVAVIAVAIAESAAAGTWLRLKVCAVPGCGQAFYDGSASSAADRCAAHAAG